MPRILSIGPTLLLFIGFAMPAMASRAVIPGDFPTIQAAIDAGLDTIAVGERVTPERLSVWRFVVIEPGPRDYQDYLPMWRSMPVIQSIWIWNNCETGWCGPGIPADGPGISVRGVRVLGEVRSDWLRRPAPLEFEACRLDSGLTTYRTVGGPFLRIRVQGCAIFSKVDLEGYVQFIGNAVIGGQVGIWSDGTHDIRHNYIQGPADAGLNLQLTDSYGPVSGNTIRGTTHGIRYNGNPFGTWTSGNDIADCSGTGIFFDLEDIASARCDSNLIARCGGAGILLRNRPSQFPTSSAWILGNSIRQTGGNGIDLGVAAAVEARGNSVLDAGGDGFVARGIAIFEDNVVGRSAGSGVLVTESLGEFKNNTIVANGAAGLRLLEIAAAGRITRNIFAFNRGMGLKYENSYDPELSCNDWFANAMGGAVGTDSDSSDLSVDPLFCDLVTGDVHLAANSPLLSHPTCGRVGALGQGCGAIGPTTSVAAGTSDGVPVLHAFPNPASGSVLFSLTSLALPAEIEVYDVTGARRWQSVVPAGEAQIEWDRRESSGRMAAPGIYFARLLRGGEEVAKLRMVLTR